MRYFYTLPADTPVTTFLPELTVDGLVFWRLRRSAEA